ncbi:MAG: NADH-quinone oxidoreductase subunit M [Oligoflexia bacterium]|nr:NADH-quinone oxidoreductase subunit M [Oligoflexia bacterium]
MNHLLSLVTFLPLIGALVVFVSPKGTAKWLALAVSLLTFVVSVPLWFLYDPAAHGLAGWETFQLVDGPYPWIADLGISYTVGIDGISLLLVLLTTLLTPLVIYSSMSSIHKKVGQYMGFMLILETAMLGSFVALDTFLFYVFWELMLIPMYFIIGVWGGPNRVYAALKFFIYTLVGSLLMLIAIVALYVFHFQQFGFWSASILDLYNVALPFRTEALLFAAFVLAFAIKVPMFPLHTWLPDAHVQAPTGGSVILAGVMLKLGTYGFLRFAMPLFPQATHEYGGVIAGLAAIGIVYGALVAMAQDDMKKLVAYSSVSHMGVIMLGLFALNTEGVSGSVYQMLNHGLSTGALFLLVGIIYERRHTREIAEYGGLATSMPKYSFVLLVVAFSSIGLPGLNGFIGEALSLLGAFHTHPVATVVGTSGVIFGAVYMLWMVQRVVFGPLTIEANKTMPDLTGREIAYLAPILVLIVVMGVAPGPILAKLEPSVDRLLVQVNSQVDLLAQPDVAGGQR